MQFDKLLLFQKLLEKGIKPTGPTSTDFEATVVSILHEKIREEVERSKKIFKQNKWPVIDVTRKSVEETAASIIKMYEIKKKNA